jgi:hypothetical protein
VVDYDAFSDVPAGGAGTAHIEDEGGAPGQALAFPLRRGTRVYHRRFGTGVVEACEGPDKVVARFKGFGPKKVMLEYLTLPK